MMSPDRETEISNMRLKKWSPFSDDILQTNLQRSSLGRITLVKNTKT